jgi:ribonuclease P protein subunit RPR2
MSIQRKNFYFNIVINTVILGKQVAKLVAQERILILIRNAFQKIDDDYELANSQAQIAKKIAKRLRLKLPYDIRQLYCKKCKQFIVPGFNCRVRIGRSKIKALRITCLLCNNVYRKLL